MTNFGEPLTYWQSLSLAVDHGDLYLDATVAQACSTACDEYLVKLRAHQSAAKMLGRVTGLGEFDSGKDLRRIFSEKAVGGENNLVDVLQSHIDVVEKMKIVFQKLIVDTEGQDRENAVGLGLAGPK
ncbi:hypothetical protein [Rhodococcoides yunnanense]|uniref:hypothetical protein n=1 Tax=Rhodococcoides yunnanense TaxID=278209 RepID=UPI0009322129|nr:hypothetical protein [Rhodococcus yunnanensis]